MEPPPPATGAGSKFNGCLKVVVLDCSNVPKPDRSSSLNPYVNITFQGIKKKTAYKKAELNPSWNEVFNKLTYNYI
jgi:Ca2+-dependent lipid-binding protein